MPNTKAKTAAEIMSRAMRNSKAWPVVFASGASEELARASVEALMKAGYVIVRDRTDPEGGIPGRDIESR